MEDKEIVKAKELIKKLGEAYDNYYDCSKGMPYDIDTTLLHSAICLKNFLNELNRLQSKVEHYKKSRDKYQDDVMYLSKQCDELQAENERLESLSERLGDDVDLKLKYIYELEEKLKTAKAEAYKECIEKVKENSNKMDLVCSGALVRTDYTITEQKLDNLLKELVGE